MIKLFSLNHTRTRKFLILAQDKTQCSTSHCQDISCPKYLGQRPHELLGQLFKEHLSCCSIKVAYSTSFRHLVNRLFFAVSASENRRKTHRLTANSRCAFYTEPPPCQLLFRRIFETFSSSLSSSYRLSSDPFQRAAPQARCAFYRPQTWCQLLL